jgi:hypothetical protein
LIRRFVKTAVTGFIYGLCLCHHDGLRVFWPSLATGAEHLTPERDGPV